MSFRNRRRAQSQSRKNVLSRRQHHLRLQKLEERHALAATFSWTGLSDGNWFNSGNWSFVSGTDNGNAGIPDSGDSATFSNGGAPAASNASPVTLGTLTVTAGSLNLGATLSVDTADFAANTGTVNASAAPLVVSNQLKLTPSVTGVISAGNTITVSGTNIVNDTVAGAGARTLVLSGGTLSFPPAATGFSYFRITSDADSGLSNTNLYTHAINPSGGSDVVNAIPFTGAGTGNVASLATRSYLLNGVTNTTIPNSIASSNFGDAAIGTNLNGWTGLGGVGNMRNVYSHFNHSTPTLRPITLTGLQPETYYSVRTYEKAWDPSVGRNYTIGYDVGADASVEFTSPMVDQNHPENTTALSSIGVTQQGAWVENYIYRTGPGQTSIKLNINGTPAVPYHTHAITNQAVTMNGLSFPNTRLVASAAANVDLRSTSSSSTFQNITVPAASQAAVPIGVPTITFPAGALSHTVGTPTQVGAGITLTQALNGTITGASVTINGYSIGTSTDALAAPSLFGGITVQSNLNGVLTLTGNASFADYQQTLSAVTFDKMNFEGVASRQITFQVTDAAAFTGMASRTVLINANAGVQEIMWDGGGDGSTWSDANNWSPNQVPDGNDVALFADTDPGAVSVTAATTVGGLKFNSSAGNVFTVGGSALTLANVAGIAVESGSNSAHVIQAPLVLTGNSFVDVTGANLTISGTISGSVGLTKSNGGTLVLSGTNTYTGQTVINGGTLRALGSSPSLPINLSNTAGGLNIADTNHIKASSFYNPDNRAPHNVSNWSGQTGTFPNGTASIDPANTPWLSNNSTGVGTWIAWDLGSVYTIDRAHIWNYNEAQAGPQYPGRGVRTFDLQIATSTPPEFGGVGAWITVQASVDWNNTALYRATGLASYAGFDFNWAAAFTSQYVRFNNTFNYGTPDNYTGLAEVVFYTQALGSGNPIPDASQVNIVSGTLDLAGTSETIGSLAGFGIVTSSAGGASTLTIGGDNAPASFGGQIQNGSGTISLTKIGTGTQQLSGANTYSGTTTVNGGTLQLGGSGDRLPTGTTLTLGASGRLDLNDQSQALANLAGTGRVVDSGAGAGNNLTLNLASGTTTFAGILGNAAQNSFNLIKNGGGTLALTGVNTYTGSTTINGGNVTISADSGLGTAPGAATPGHLFLANNATLATTAGFTIGATRGITLGSGGGQLSIAGGVTYGGLFHGGGGFTKVGTGDLVLTNTAAGTAPGTITISTGRLFYVDQNTVGAGNININGGSFNKNTGSPVVTLTNAVTLANGAGITNRGGNLTFNNLTLPVNNGTAIFNSDDQPTNAGQIIVPGNLTLTNTFTVQVGGNNANVGIVQFAGMLSGAGSLTKTQAGILHLNNGGNSFSGDVNVAAGTVRVTQNGALGSTAGATNVLSGGTLNFDGGFNYTTAEIVRLAGAGAGSAGALSKTGTGDVVLSTPIALLTSATISNNTAGTNLTINPNIALNGGNLTFAGVGNTIVNGNLLGSTGNTIAGLNSLPTGDHSFTAAGQTFNARVEDVGGTRWLLIGRGRQGWEFDTDGQGAVGSVNLGAGLGTPAAFAPAAYSDALINDLLLQSGITNTGVEIRLKRATNINDFANAQEARFRGFASPTFTFDFDTGASGLTATYEVQAGVLGGAVAPYGTNTRDTDPSNAIGGGYSRTFTWLWGGHNSQGFSYGLGINGGLNNTANPNAFIWESTATSIGTGANPPFGEDHAIPYAEVYIRSLTPGPVLNSIIKNGAGTVTLNGANNYAGATTINAGVLAAGHNSALGTTTAGTTVASGATLALQRDLSNNPITVAEPVTAIGTGAGGNGAIRNLIGNNTLSGQITTPTGLFGTPSAVPLQNATAFASQPSWSVATLLDGITTGANGWADDTGGVTNANEAVFETVTDLGTAGTPTELTFTLPQTSSAVAQHNLGRFRLSYTTDARTTFADGLINGGDTTATWIVLTPTSATSAGGATLSILGDGSVLASGTSPATDTYVIKVQTLVTGITGFRIEALLDASFPTSGPGRAANGNYVLTEFQVGAAAPAGGSLGIASDADTLTISTGISATLSPTSLAFGGAGNVAVNGPISQPSGITGVVKNGAGTVTLFGNNSYGGTTTVNAGTLIAAHNNALGTPGAGTIVASGATLALQRDLSNNPLIVAEPITALGTGVGGNGAIRNLLGNNTLSGPITMSGGATFGAPVSVPLAQATAFGSQPSWEVTKLLDGILTGGNGWADDIGGVTNANTAVFETVTNLGAAGTVTELTFTLPQTSNVALHNVGRFRISYTTDVRTDFADGAINGGDITANWTVLAPTSATSDTAGVVLTILSDGSVLASGTNPNTNTYVVKAQTLATNITGFRLEMIIDASLPTSGPGRATNGNYVLTEFQVGAASLPLAGTLGIASDADTLTISNNITAALSNGSLAFSGAGNVAVNGNIASGAPAISLATLDNFATGDYSVTAAGQTFTAHVDNDGTDSWLLIGRGREGWQLDTDGQGTTAAVSQNLGLPAGFAPAAYSDAIVNALLNQSFVSNTNLEIRLKRAANIGGTAYQESRLRDFTNVGFTFNIDQDPTGLPATWEAFASALGGGQAPMASNTRDTFVALNDQTRLFTWAWAGHNNLQGFSYGQSINGGTLAGDYLWVFGANAHALPYTEVYIRSLTTTPVASSLNLIKNGTGTLSLGGNNTYSGSTTVNAGTLLATNTAGSATSGGAVTVSNATLGGTGAINGTVQINSGGRVAPGLLPGTTGTLRVNNTVTFATGSHFDVDFASGAADKLEATGAVTVNAGVNLNLPSSLNFVPNHATGETFQILDNQSGGATGAFANIAPGTAIIVTVPGPLTRQLRLTHTSGTGANDVALLTENRAPTTVSAGGPYSISEGSGVTLTGTGSDPDGDTLVTEWDLNGNGLFAEAGVEASITSLAAAGTAAQLNALGMGDGGNPPTTFAPRVRATDNIAPVSFVTSVAGSFTVNNVNPTIGTFTVPAGGFEGSPVNLLAAATDAANAFSPNDPLTYTWTITSASPVFNQVLSGVNLTNPSFIPPNEGTYSVSLAVTDGDGGSVPAGPANVVVANVAPSALINGLSGPNVGSAGVGPGQPVTLTFGWFDPGPTDVITRTINWGDGSPLVTGFANGATLSHSYLTVGAYTITETVNDGTATGVTTYTVNVLRFFEDADGNVIFGGENNGVDVVGLTYNSRTGLLTLRHTLNGASAGSYSLNPAANNPIIKVFGQGQNDTMGISGEFPFRVEFSGGAGNDKLTGGSQDDVLDGGLGNDTLIGGLGNDTLLGGGGADKMDASGGDDLLDGGEGNDSMTGNTGNDTLLGGLGNDTMNGVAGDDLLDGGEGNDSMDGGQGNDAMLGGGGNDKLGGSSGFDVLLGGAGLDTLNGGNEDDILIADDVALADPHADALAIRDAWANGAGSYSTRVDDMIASLLDSSMVSGDGARETIVGGNGFDWFLLDLAVAPATIDRMKDLVPGERFNDNP